jgi:hypothetical protein
VKTDYQAVNGRIIACGDSAAIPDRNNPSTLGQAGCTEGPKRRTTRQAHRIRRGPALERFAHFVLFV